MISTTSSTDIDVNALHNETHNHNVAAKVPITNIAFQTSALRPPNGLKSVVGKTTSRAANNPRGAIQLFVLSTRSM
jgi:hypothetical protein